MTERITCGTCRGDGFVYVNDTNTTCPECKGEGHFEYEAAYRLTNPMRGVYQFVQYKRDTDMWGKRIEWVLDSNGNPMTFTDGQKAANMAKRLTNRYADARTIDYAADSGDFDTWTRITPDPAGEDAAADDGRPVDVLRTAWRDKMATIGETLCKGDDDDMKAGTKLKRRINKVDTRYIEEQIGLCRALKDWGGAAALGRLAKYIGAPIEETVIARYERAAKDVKEMSNIPDYGKEYEEV